jgi:pimeloyl-ACP methyl ester carboxylesterase
MNTDIKQIITGGTHLSYRMVGKGPAVLFIPGFAEDHHIWDEQVAHLSANYRCIVPDLFGIGLSGEMQLEKITSLHDIAICLNEILIHEEIKTVSIFGHSMGGYLALEFATAFPKKTNAIGLIHSTAYADSVEKKNMRLKVIRHWEKFGSKSTQRTSIPSLFAEQNKALPFVQQMIEKAEKISTETMIRYYQMMMDRPDHCQLLQSLPIPFLFVAGIHDLAVPFEHTIEQSKLPQNTELHLLEQSGHMGMLEETEKINQILRRFVERL